MQQDISRMTAVMNAAAHGAQIECISLDEPNDKWSITNNPRWNWMHFDYRVADGKNVMLIRVDSNSMETKSTITMFDSVENARKEMQSQFISENTKLENEEKSTDFSQLNYTSARLQEQLQPKLIIWTINEV